MIIIALTLKDVTLEYLKSNHIQQCSHTFQRDRSVNLDVGETTFTSNVLIDFIVHLYFVALFVDQNQLIKKRGGDGVTQ